MLLSLAMSSLFHSAYAQNEIRDDVTGLAFPREITFQHDNKDYHLQATGVATRKKLFVKVYSIASYLQAGDYNSSNIMQQILSDDTAKQLTIKWAHDVELEKIVGAYKEGFQKAFSESERAQLQADIQKYLSAFGSSVKKGDEHVIRWLPGGYVEVLFNGTKAGDVKNANFAKGLWSIWFGPNSIVEKERLVSLVK
jgi:hypothetical protein